tara:strand:+ start:506 stop:880 length:375 start_codon:yes stop_codon:yes gene_type:complete
VLNIGNDGKSYPNSGAGPSFGIYPLGQNLNDLIYKNVALHLKKTCSLNPKISTTQWDEIIEPLYADDISVEDYGTLNGNLYGGILPLGSQGCSCIHALVLNGPHKGRVVNLDKAEQIPPLFSEH